MKSAFWKKIVAVAATVSLLPLMVSAQSTTENLTMNAGTLSVTSPSSVTITTQTVATTDQTSTGTVTGTAPTDTRGSGAGWTVSMTSTHITRTAGTVNVGGTAGGEIGFTGTYTCATAPVGSNGGGRYRVEITTSGAVGTAAFKWKGPDDVETTAVTTAASLVLNSGVNVTFTGSQTTGRAVALMVGCHVYTQNTATPQTLAATSGSTTGVTLQSAGAFSGSGTTSSAKSLLIAEGGAGMGAYTFDTALSQTVRKNSISGAHSATLTVTAA